MKKILGLLTALLAAPPVIAMECVFALFRGQAHPATKIAHATSATVMRADAPSIRTPGEDCRFGLENPMLTTEH